MKAQRRWIGWRISPFLGASVGAHLLLLIVVVSTSLGKGCEALPSSLGTVAMRHTGPIDVTMIEPKALNPYATPMPVPALELQEIQKKQEEARKPEEDPNVGGQVVDVAKPDVEIRPDSARFLGEYDNKVEHETKGKPGDGKAGARHSQKQQAATAPPPSQASPPRQEVKPVAPRAPTIGGGGAGGKGALAMRTPTDKPSQARGKEDGLERSAAEGTEANKGEGQRADQQKGLPGESSPGQEGVEGQSASPGSPEVAPHPNLRPSDEMVAQAVGAGSNDYLKDVDEGTETLLNTKRWKYWSFFSRVKKDVAQSWRPDAAYRLRDPTGQIYGNKNRFTVLKVSLRPDGTLRDVMVEKPCGVDFLDDEAVTAFREAQPFPNPPDGLVDPDSRLITFRFGFYFEINGAPTFKIFRQ